MIIDTHAHYDDAKFAEDLETCLEDVRAAGVSYIINAAQNLETTRKIMEMAKKFPYLYGTAGIHPHEAALAKPSDYAEFRRLTADGAAAKNKIVAIGETGLDYYYDFSPRDVQKENFTRHIELALEVGLPLVVHDRDAHEADIGENQHQLIPACLRLGRAHEANDERGKDDHQEIKQESRAERAGEFAGGAAALEHGRDDDARRGGAQVERGEPGAEIGRDDARARGDIADQHHQKKGDELVDDRSQIHENALHQAKA